MKKNQGLTLIEMLIFIAAASIGFLILSASYTGVLEHSATGEYLSVAASLCEGKMEETIATYSYNTVPSTSPSAFDPPFDNYTYQVTWFHTDPIDLNTDAGSSTGYKNVQVIVDHDCIEPVVMTTVLTDY